MRILLDISRSVARTRHGVATGIDRVERAYADWAMGREGSRFLVSASGLHCVLDAKGARALFQVIDAGEAGARDMIARLSAGKPSEQRAAETHVRRLAVRTSRKVAQVVDGPALYLNVAHAFLDQQRINDLKSGGVARIVTMLHDMIPLTHPEFARAGGRAKFERMWATMLQSDAIISISEATSAQARQVAANPPITTIPIGMTPARPGTAAQPGSFVMLGTIEPRKNHLGILTIWRDLAAAGRAPKLSIIGRRGWENDVVFNTLDRAGFVRDHVWDAGPLPDDQAAAEVAGARAVLCPSFTEGFGLPPAEALALGAPVIASDIPAHREVCGDVPDYVDPLDLAGWRQVVLDYAAPDSPRRAAQLDRLTSFQPPRWEDHFTRLTTLLDEVAKAPSPVS